MPSPTAPRRLLRSHSDWRPRWALARSCAAVSAVGNPAGERPSSCWSHVLRSAAAATLAFAAIWPTTKLSSCARKLGSSDETTVRGSEGSATVLRRSRRARASLKSASASWRVLAGTRSGRPSMSAVTSRTRAAASQIAHTSRRAARARDCGAAWMTISSSQRSSSTSRTTARALVLNPVGRNGVAKNVAWSASIASLDAAAAFSVSPLSRAASARHASMAPLRTGSRSGAGHIHRIAGSEHAAARPHPASRSGIAAAGAARDTGRMKASSSVWVAPARTELATPANSTPKPTTAIATAASQLVCETSVAMAISAPHATARAIWLRRRSRIAPRKSARSSIAKAPNAEKVATVGFSMTFTPSANRAGMTIADRDARRNAANPGSRLRNQATATTRLP